MAVSNRNARAQVNRQILPRVSPEATPSSPATLLGDLALSAASSALYALGPVVSRASQVVRGETMSPIGVRMWREAHEDLKAVKSKGNDIWKVDFDPTVLDSLAPAQFKQPVIIIPGWHSTRDRFDLAASKVAGGPNEVAYVHKGKFFRDNEATEQIKPPADTMVFVVVHEDVGDAPQKTGPQLFDNVDAIRKLTGKSTVDAVAYSQGGMSARTYLQMGGELGKVFFLGGPHQGTAKANLAFRMVEAQKRGFPTKHMQAANTIDERDHESLAAISKGSQFITELNAKWAEQKSRTEDVVFVGSAQDSAMKPGSTIASYYMSSEPGDGMVAAGDFVPTAAEKLLMLNKENAAHARMPSSLEVWEHAYDFFGW